MSRGSNPTRRSRTKRNSRSNSIRWVTEGWIPNCLPIKATSCHGTSTPHWSLAPVVQAGAQQPEGEAEAEAAPATPNVEQPGMPADVGEQMRQQPVRCMYSHCAWLCCRGVAMYAMAALDNLEFDLWHEYAAGTARGSDRALGNARAVQEAAARSSP